jgi:LPS export ABC transporter protein LptC
MSARWFAFAALALLMACNPKAPGPGLDDAGSSPSASPTGISLKITGNGKPNAPTRFVYQKNNRKYYQLTAKSFESLGAAGTAHVTLTQVQASFFALDGSKLDAFAPHGTIDQLENQVTLFGGVHATNSAGMSLSCDTLTYDRDTQMIHGVGHVVIANKTGFHGTGNRFDSDITLTHTTMR